MRWLTVMVGALAALIASSPASSATFVANVSAPPSYGVAQNGRTYAFGSATFPDVILHEGDDLALNVDFGGPITIPAIRAESFVYSLNVFRGASNDSGRVVFNYPYGVFLGFSEGDTGFSIDAVATHVFGPPDPSTTFDINSVSYQINPAPEPYTWVIMAVGMAGIGIMLRITRRSRGAYSV